MTKLHTWQGVFPPLRPVSLTLCPFSTTMSTYDCPTAVPGCLSPPERAPSSAPFALRPAHDTWPISANSSYDPYPPEGRQCVPGPSAGGIKRRREQSVDTTPFDVVDDRATSNPPRRKAPCVQCAQAGVAEGCSQNRRTIGCVRCNAQRLACSYRTGQYTSTLDPGACSPVPGAAATPHDFDVPQLIRSVEGSLSLVLEHTRHLLDQSRHMGDRVVTIDQIVASGEQSVRLTAHLDALWQAMELRVVTHFGGLEQRLAGLEEELRDVKDLARELIARTRPAGELLLSSRQCVPS